MIEIRVTKELGNYEPKLVGPLTIRQVVCLSIGVPICISIYKALSPHVTEDIAGFFCAIPAAIACAFGWCKPYGMKTEQFIKGTFINMVLAPSHRIYKTTNYHEAGLKMINEYEELSNASDDAAKSKEKKKEKAPKYKLSPEASK